MFVFFLCFDAGQWYGFSERVTKLHCSEPVELEVTIKVAFCTNFVKCYWTTPLLVGFYWIWTNFCRVAIASTCKGKRNNHWNHWERKSTIQFLSFLKEQDWKVFQFHRLRDKWQIYDRFMTIWCLPDNAWRSLKKYWHYEICIKALCQICNH